VEYSSLLKSGTEFEPIHYNHSR